MKSGLISLILLSLALASSNIYAKPLAERCKLDSACGVPGNDGGITYYKVTPQTGTAYNCTLWTSGEGELKIWAYSGKGYIMTKGGGLYVANPVVNFNVDGYFFGTGEKIEGEIKIFKSGEGPEGHIMCKPTKQ